MRRILLIFSVLLPFLASAQQPDSAKTAELGRKLAEYYKALEHETIDVQKRECDFLIEAVSDSLLKQFVAMDIYGHYMDSPLMGSENVAVHVYDKWFATGAVPMKSESDRIAAKVFAEFNRQSLIGEKAPSLTLESHDGTVEEIMGPASKGFRVVYFYDTDCSKCRIETILLRNLLNSGKYPVELYAIYTGNDSVAWHSYVKDHLTVKSARHYWDPEVKSDFQRKYGVLQTPRLLLVGPDGVIIGRGLDVKSLEMLLDGIFAEKELEYGSEESVALYDAIFDGGMPSAGQVRGIADYIHDRTLAKGDTLMFRQMAGDYLYYLASHAGEGYKEGMRYHIDRNILTDDGVWKSSDDSLKVIGFARIMSDLLSKAAPGDIVPDLKVPGTLYTSRGSRHVDVRLGRLKGDVNIIMFVTEGCEVCATQKKAALALLDRAHDNTLPKEARTEARKTKVFMVNMDEIMTSSPTLSSRLMDAFDLSSLPFVLTTDRGGTILRRYLTF